MRRKNWEPSEHSYLCSEHFGNDCFVEGLKIRRLKPTAEPTIFAKFPHYLKPSKPAERRPLKRVLSQSNNLDLVVQNGKDQLSETKAVINDHAYCQPSPKKIKLQLDNEKTKSSELKTKLKTCQKQNQRLQATVASLTEAVIALKEKHLVGEDAYEALKKCASEVPFELFERLRKKLTVSKNTKEVYPEPLKNFAMTLHFYSPKAYHYIRQVFNLSLPHESALRRWYTNVDGSPGFTDQSFKQLEIKVADEKRKNKEVIVQLVTDEMAIRKHISFDGSRFVGCVDLGINSVTDDTSPPATEALVIMAVAINSSWKIPLAYFLISSMSGTERANIVKTCGRKLMDIGVHIVGTTCDGPATNLSMMLHLGASINPETPDPDFTLSENSNEKLSVIFDVCHMIKLVRNSLADLKVLKNCQNQPIQWNYIEKLHILQTNEGVFAANKLRKSHIEFHRQKMKVSLAAQTLSRSVAEALRFCRSELNLSEFQGSEATEEFIQIFNDVFDVMNSKNFLGKNLKAPMTLENEITWSKIFEKTTSYILGLSLPNGQKLIHSRRKTGFLGFLVNIQSIRNIFDRFVRTHRLTFLLTYKLSQDHLELFFGCIRSRLGCNNNPTAAQFEKSYKHILLHGILKGLQGNCLPQDDTEVLSLDLQSINPDEVQRHYNMKIEEFDHDYVNCLTQISELTNFQEAVSEYIAGFVMRQVLSSLRCEICCQAVSKRNPIKTYKLVNVKDKGGLIHVSPDLKKVCEVAEICLQRITRSHQGTIPLSRTILPAIVKTVLETVFERYS